MTVVPSWMTTPRSSRTRRRPRARAAGWIVAAPGMNAPARSTGDCTRARTSSADSATRAAASPTAAHASTASSQPPSWAGAALAEIEPAFRYQQSTPCSADHVPRCVDRLVDGPRDVDRADLPVPLDQRRQLVPPARREPAVAARRAAAADVGLEQHDPGARCDLGQPERRPHPGVPATQDDDVGRRGPAQRRGGTGQVRRGGRSSAASASRSHHDRRSPLGRTPPSIAVSCLPAAGRSARDPRR